MLKFEKNDYTIEELTMCGENVGFGGLRVMV